MGESKAGTALARGDVGRLGRGGDRAVRGTGPAAISLRDVAARAGVNYGLIHQYIGTKDDLLRLVVQQVSEQTAERVAVRGGSVRDLVADVVRGGASPYLQTVALGRCSTASTARRCSTTRRP